MSKSCLWQAVLQFRLGYPPEKWRNVFKALTVLDFLVRRGSERCVALAREELACKLGDMERFAYVAPDGRDHGASVRHRTHTIRALLEDEHRLEGERAAFAKKRRTYQGFSREQLPPARGFTDDMDLPSPHPSPRNTAGPSLRRTVSFRLQICICCI